MENWNLFGIYDCSKISGTKYIKNQYKTYKISVQTNSKKSRPAAVCTYFSGIISFLIEYNKKFSKNYLLNYTDVSSQELIGTQDNTVSQ